MRISAAYSLLSLSSRYGSEYAVADDRHRATDSILQRWRHHLVDQTIAQVFQFMEQHHLLIMAIFQLIQRLTDRLNIALAQHLTDELQLAAATFHLNTLGELNSRAQIRI